MNINMGPETVEDLYEAGYIKDTADLYTLEISDLLRLERWADKSARNLMASLEESKQVPFERVLYGLGIRFVGETVAKRLVAAFHSMDQLEQASFEDLIAVDEIGERIARSIIAYFADERNRNLVNRLKEYGLRMSVAEEVLANRSEKLKGPEHCHQRDIRQTFPRRVQSHDRAAWREEQWLSVRQDRLYPGGR